MKKIESKLLLWIALIAILIFASVPLWHINLNTARPQTHVVKKKHKKVVHKVTWGYPFKKLYEKRSNLNQAKNSVRLMSFVVITQLKVTFTTDMTLDSVKLGIQRYMRFMPERSIK
ncbi:hypothetical protein IMAU60204_01160 [Lactobacillus helveticus]|nr:hypothetical protein LBH_1813 [Lactobacillus helveticus H9]NRO08500.1 hypothetical protein [Lactobacillus helveticus]NRO46672.1 hypothetical protein [Lactobacillus helveticus]NRO72344.1 hypothetical protein [Lactobacillus helveticus]